jgi:hypothetical protein
MGITWRHKVAQANAGRGQKREVAGMRQEPIAYINVEQRKLEFAKPIMWHTPTVVNLERIPLYTHQRTWVGLTDEEITALKHNGERYISSQDFARAVEAKLKQKNGYAEENKHD